jgi:hypothetical protein
LLPATTATIFAYLGTLFDGGRLRGTSVRPYVAANGAQHSRLGLIDPTAHSLVQMARRGIAAADAQRRTGDLLRSAAYPADAALFCLRAALRPGLTATALRYWAVVAVDFLITARPASILGLSPDSLRISSDAVYVELRVFKYGTSGFAPRVAVRIPTPAPGDLIRLVFTRLLALPCARRSDPLFRASDLALATAAGLRAVSAVAPPGALHCPLLAQRRYLSRVRGWRSVGAHNAREQPRVYRGRAAA